MTRARDVMNKEVVTLKKDMPVKKAAEIFLKTDISGAPVVDENGQIIGIVAESDLIMPDVKIHFPHFIQFLDSIILLGSYKRFENEVKKAVAATIADVMTKEVVTVGEDTEIEDVATLLMDKNISRLPVLKNNKLVGIISKRDIVKAISKGI